MVLANAGYGVVLTGRLYIKYYSKGNITLNAKIAKVVVMWCSIVLDGHGLSVKC